VVDSVCAITDSIQLESSWIVRFIMSFDSHALSDYDLAFGKAVRGLGFEFTPELIEDADLFAETLQRQVALLSQNSDQFEDLTWSSQASILSKVLPDSVAALFPTVKPKSLKRLNYGLAYDAFMTLLKMGCLPGYVFTTGPSPSIKWLPLSPCPKPQSSPLPRSPGSPVPRVAGSPTVSVSAFSATPRSPHLEISDSGKDKLRSLSSDSNWSSSSSSSSEEDLPSIAGRLLSSASDPKKGTVLDFAPVPFQKIFKLEKYLPQYAELEDERQLVAKDGKISLKKNPRRITSPSLWLVAMNGLGRHLEMLRNSGKSDSEFEWSQFILYCDRVHAFFSAYTFDSVILFDQAFRKWRRFHRLPWSSDNSVLRDLICRVKSHEKASPSAGSVPICRNWNKGTCSRRDCKYRHVCSACSSPSHGKSSCDKGPSKGPSGTH